MKGLDGRQAANLIRAIEAEAGGGHIPIIALTAMATDEERQRGFSAGMDTFLAKPIDPEELYYAVESAPR